MKTIGSKIIITADEIPINKNVYQELNRIKSLVKIGRIEYGGKYYSKGYALVMDKSCLSKLSNKKFPFFNDNDVKALAELSNYCK